MLKSFFTMLVFLWTLILLVYIANAQEFIQQRYVPDEVLVRFKAGVSQEELDTAKTNCHIKYNSKHEAISTWNFKITDGKDPKDTVECLSREPAVMQAEPNYIAPLPGIPDTKPHD